LRALCESPNSQLSLRPLRWADFQAAIQAQGRSTKAVLFRAERLAGGHKRASVRVRVGQARFRQALLSETGSLCALTGAAPPAALEACHLYSYAKVGEHHVCGGVLLRRDIHRLFDSGLLAVNPQTLKIDVASSLGEFPVYASLAGHTVSALSSAKARRWLLDHWRQHRGPFP